MTERRVLIADDEPAARRGVRQLLAAHPRWTVAAECRNGAETLRAIDATAADLLFLDVQMPGLGGFDVIRQRAAASMPLVIFLTAFEEHAVRAFEVDACDYLVKPVSQSRFDAALRRAERQLASGAAAEPRLVVPAGRGSAVLAVADIDWVESADNYARIWVGARSYLLREPLDLLERRIGVHGFTRAHRRALVRIGAIRATRLRGDELVVTLGSGTEVTVSRRRRAAFLRSLRASADVR
jgi:two-component system LytT family response regulator